MVPRKEQIMKAIDVLGQIHKGLNIPYDTAHTAHPQGLVLTIVYGPASPIYLIS